VTAIVVAGAAAGLTLLALAPAGTGRPRRRLRALAVTSRSAVVGPDRRSVLPVALTGAAGSLVLGAPTPVLVAAFGVPFAGRWVVRRRTSRRLLVARRAECVEVVHALAAELRAGRPPGVALSVVGESAAALHELLSRAALAVGNGADAASELRRVAEVPGCAVFGAVAAAWSVTDRVGGPVADVLERIAAGLEADRLQRESLDAAMAGPRATTTLLAVLPLLGVALGRSMGADPVGLLLHRPLGWALLGAAGVLEILGVLWMGRIARSATR
jgi:tight adherence protein B